MSPRSPLSGLVVACGVLAAAAEDATLQIGNCELGSGIASGKFSTSCHLNLNGRNDAGKLNTWLGIGTEAPNNPLHVYYPGGEPGTAGQQVATFESSRTGDKEGTYIALYAHTGNVLRSGVWMANIGDHMVLGADGAERVRVSSGSTTLKNSLIVNGLDSDGTLVHKLGIGTDSPDVPLYVKFPGKANAGQQVATFESTREGSSDGTYLGIYANTGGQKRSGVAVANVGDHLKLWADGAERISVNNVVTTVKNSIEMTEDFSYLQLPKGNAKLQGPPTCDSDSRGRFWFCYSSFGGGCEDVGLPGICSFSPPYQDHLYICMRQSPEDFKWSCVS